MFEISWSELLILAIVTLVFVGPKELPVFLRTLGRYAGVVRRHANEFKAQFDAAMREAELELDAQRGRADAVLDQLRGDAGQDVVQRRGNVDASRAVRAREPAGVRERLRKAANAEIPPMPAPPSAPPRMEP